MSSKHEYIEELSARHLDVYVLWKKACFELYKDLLIDVYDEMVINALSNRLSDYKVIVAKEIRNWP